MRFPPLAVGNSNPSSITNDKLAITITRITSESYRSFAGSFIEIPTNFLLH
jgi:hypothetical protein